VSQASNQQEANMEDLSAIGLKRSPEGINRSKEKSDEWQLRKEAQWQKWRDKIKSGTSDQ
jgi:hypothetical protein